VNALQTESGRPSLYASIRAGADDVRAAWVPNRVNAVVVITNGLSDGANALLDLVLAIRQQPVNRRVPIFIVALTTPPGLADSLRTIADESGGLFYDASEPGRVDGAIRNALLNL
jgi:Ca-activated chloride channel family protein